MSVTRRILLLGGIELLLAAGGLAIAGRWAWAPETASITVLVLYTLALSLIASLPRVYVEHGRHASWITPADGALLVGLFLLGPVALVVAAVISEVLIALRLRQPALKAAFNLVSMSGGVAWAAAVFALLGRSDPQDPWAWAAAALALGTCAVWDVLSTAAVLAIAEDRPAGRLIRELLPSALVSFALSTALGLVALVLLFETGWGVLLFVPLLGVLLVSTRAYGQQQAERQRLERLYDASGRLAELAPLDDTLARIADEARTLATGTAALCAVEDADGSRVAQLVDDRGRRPAPAALIDGASAVLADAGDRATGTMDVEQLPAHLRRLLPAHGSLVWAARPVATGRRLLTVVLRDLPAEEDQHRSDILATFATQAATVVANVGLHDDVRTALDQQVAINQQKSEFVANVSHELRTPLTSMIAAVQTVRRHGRRLEDDERDHVLELGLDQAARLRGLIEDLLLVAAADHRDVHAAADVVDLSRLASELAEEFSASLGDRLEVDVRTPSPPVVTDGEKLRRVLVNLLDNARKYGDDGPVTLTVARVDGHVEWRVADRGPGIAPADRERIFERFVQLDGSATRRQGGTGLGLHLCREIARLLDAELAVVDRPGGGACFVLRLPDRRPAAGDPGRSAGRALGSGPLQSPLRRPTGRGQAPGATVSEPPPGPLLAGRMR